MGLGREEVRGRRPFASTVYQTDRVSGIPGVISSIYGPAGMIFTIRLGGAIAIRESVFQWSISASDEDSDNRHQV